MIYLVAAYVAISLDRMACDIPAKAVPTIIGRLYAAMNSLIQVTQVLIEVSLYVIPAGNIG
jgi:hypothetical protein